MFVMSKELKHQTVEYAELVGDSCPRLPGRLNSRSTDFKWFVGTALIAEHGANITKARRTGMEDAPRVGD